MAVTPTQRTLELLRKQGFTAHVVEKWNSFAKIRQDFGGFADILAYHPGQTGVLAVQATSEKGGVSKRVKKTVALANVKTWLMARNQFEVWGWGLKGARGETKHWECRIVAIKLGANGEIVAGE